MKGWRDATVDIDLKLDPEPAGAFEAIATAFRAKLERFLRSVQL
jgi:hypothetical protein